MAIRLPSVSIGPLAGAGGEEAAADRLSIAAFGSFSVRWNGRSLGRLGTGKTAALMAYLATESGPHRREVLAELLWPSLPAPSARLNLRQTLFQLRALLTATTGHEFIEVDRSSVAFAEGAAVTVSSDGMKVPLPECDKDDAEYCARCLARMTTLAKAVQGPFLADILVPDSHRFEEWLQGKRDYFHCRALDLLGRLAACHERRGESRLALAWAMRYVELEPWSESGHLRVMRLLDLDGRPEAALAQYESCCRTLQRELGVLPDAELRQYAERLRITVPGMVSEVATRFETPQERRQMTVLHYEFETASVDPEDALAALDGPRARCAEIVRQHGGYPAETPDGRWFAYFGYPQARENAMLDAMRAALRLSGESAFPVSVRVGVHGDAIVVASGARMPDPVGTTSGMAMRLGELAGPGEVVVSEAIRRRVAGYFQFVDIGLAGGHGGRAAFRAFRTTGSSGARHRLDAAQRQTPFTGRDPEMAVLLRTWTRVRRGSPVVFLLSGEAGIGKSRLMRMFSARLHDAGARVCELRCFPETKSSPLQPLAALLATLVGCDEGDGPVERQRKLKLFLRAHDSARTDRNLALLASLPGFAGPSGSAGAVLEAGWGALRELLVALLRALAARVPLLLVAEDMHWADDLTRDALERLNGGAVPLLLFMTARPEWRPDWPGMRVLDLQPLSDKDIASMVDVLHPDMQHSRRERVVALAEGVPLFAEELAAMADGDDGELPGTLHDLLMARFDALDAKARGLAQLAAVFGRDCDMRLLGEAARLSDEEAFAAVKRLEHAGLAWVSGKRVRFKHALVQEAAYRSLARSARGEAHACVAGVLEAYRPDECGDRPELLAWHWGEAGDVARAIPLWLAAGRLAAKRHAHRSAVAHYDAGLRLVGRLPAGTERDGLEFALCVGLAQSEQAVAGYGRGRSAELLSGAVALLDKGIGQGANLFRIVWGLWEGGSSRAGHGEAVRLAERLVEIAEAEASSELRAQGHYALGNSLFWTGDFTAARRHLETARACLPPGDEDAPLRDCYGSIVTVGIDVYLSWILWLQGNRPGAEACGDRAVAVARGQGDDYGLAFSLTFAANRKYWEGEANAVRRFAEEGVAAAERCESTVFAAASRVFQGWAAVMEGDGQSIALLEEGIASIRTAMSGVVVSLLAPYAEALIHLKEHGKAMPILKEAFAQVEVTQDRHYLAELHRLEGVCLLARGRRAAARARFGKALAIARGQGARIFERRALADLQRDKAAG